MNTLEFVYFLRQWRYHPQIPNIDEWLEYTVIGSFGADFDIFLTGATVFLDIEELIEKHRLRDILELRKYPIDC